MPTDRIYTLNFLGDVMLGRLIDQLLPTHVHEPAEAQHVVHFRSRNPGLKTYTHSTSWGDTLPLFRSSDLNFINLETCATTHPVPWPDKTFNYRMHPTNVEALKIARVDYASLANNHTLDFNIEGLHETVETLDNAGILYAGAGRTKDDALRPATLRLPRSRSNNLVSKDNDGPTDQHTIHAFSAADHPSSWSTVPSFHLFDYSRSSRNHLTTLLSTPPSPSPSLFPSSSSPSSSHPPSLTTLSLHWGPNYAWHPSSEIRSLAHHILASTPCSIIHGHSSHHVQGFEIVDGPSTTTTTTKGARARATKKKKKLVIYGCGDFVDDYALVEGYRNDLSAVWRVSVAETGTAPPPPSTSDDSGGDEKKDGDGLRPLELTKLEVFPTRCKSFQTNLLERDDEDAEWVRRKIVMLSRDLGWKGEYTVGEKGQLVVEI